MSLIYKPNIVSRGILIYITFVDRLRVHVVRLLLLLLWRRRDRAMRQRERQATQDETVEQGNHRQNERPADAAGALQKIVNTFFKGMNDMDILL